MTGPLLNPLVLDPRSFPLRRPQVTCVDGDVYFGACPVARVTDLEAGLLDVCDGRRPLCETAIAAAADACCVARVASWLLWWDRPVPERADWHEPIGRLVLCARHVDGWLGMGARLLGDAPSVTTVVATCFGTLGATRFIDAFPTPSEATLVCRDESELAAQLAGVVPWTLELPDHDLRDALPPDDTREATVSEALRHALVALIERWRPGEVFAPAALGSSPDARLLFDTVLSLYGDGTLTSNLHLYEDAPVTGGYRAIDEFCARFEGSYLRPREYYRDVTETFTRRSALADVFRCTIDADEQGHWQRSAVQNGWLSGIAGTRHAERFWTLDVCGIG